MLMVMTQGRWIYLNIPHKLGILPIKETRFMFHVKAILSVIIMAQKYKNN